MPGGCFRQVRALVPLRDVLDLLGWQPRPRRGEQGRGPCPLHSSTAPTSRCFVVPWGKGVFHCCRCGAGGNALDLYAAATRQPLYPAAVELCRRLGRAVPWLPVAPPRPQQNTTLSDP
jgi:DNA primase